MHPYTVFTEYESQLPKATRMSTCRQVINTGRGSVQWTGFGSRRMRLSHSLPHDGPGTRHSVLGTEPHAVDATSVTCLEQANPESGLSPG